MARKDDHSFPIAQSRNLPASPLGVTSHREASSLDHRLLPGGCSVFLSIALPLGRDWVHHKLPVMSLDQAEHCGDWQQRGNGAQGLQFRRTGEQFRRLATLSSASGDDYLPTFRQMPVGTALQAKRDSLPAVFIRRNTSHPNDWNGNQMFSPRP